MTDTPIPMNALRDQIGVALRQWHWYRNAAEQYPGRPHLAATAATARIELVNLLRLRHTAVAGGPQALPDVLDPAVLAQMTGRQLWSSYRFCLQMRKLTKRAPKAEQDVMLPYWTRVIDQYRLAAIMRETPNSEPVVGSAHQEGTDAPQVTEPPESDATGVPVAARARPASRRRTAG